MVAITTRSGKGSPLTNAEMDANLNNLNESQTIMGEPMGHADKTQSTISFDAGTRTFTITPVGASFVVWCKGEKYTYTTAQTVVIPDTAGLHFIYFSSTGVLSTKMSYFTWDEDAPTSYVYWNATNNEAVYFADERHGVTLDWQTHEYLHRTRGAAIANGFAASGYTLSGDGSADADAQITIEGGTFFDEDMQIDIVSSNTPTANTFEQDLNSPARIPILYLEGSEWRITSPTDYPVKQGTARPQYNLYTGGAWTLVDVTNTDYTCTWILATNNLTYPVVGVISQSNLSTLNNAEAAVFEDLDLPGFPSVEFRPLYKLIFQSNNSYSNTPHTRLRGITDIRSISSVGVAPSLISDHGNLSGLTDDDHPQYLSASDVRPGIASAVKKSLIPSTPVAGGVAYGTADSLDFSAAGTAGQVMTSGGASVPTWTTATDANTASAIVKRDASGNFSAGTITASGLSNSGNLQIGNGASASLGSTAPFAWVSARALSSSNTSTSPQELLRLSWEEGSQDLGAGEGAAINFSARLVTDDAGVFRTVAQVATKKEASTDNAISALTFSTSSDGTTGNLTERARIDSSRNVGIGITPVLSLDVAGRGRFLQNVAASSGAIVLRQSSGDTEGAFIQWVNNANSAEKGWIHVDTSSNMKFATASTERMRLSSAGGLSVGTTSDPGAGAIYATGNITAYFSDDRLKTNLGNIQDALSKVKALNGFYYEANQTAQDLGYKPIREVGVSAQQVQAVMPEVVAPAPIDDKYLTVRYEKLIPLLIESIKELADRVIILEEKLKERA